jgi:translocation and assembly module TamA
MIIRRTLLLLIAASFALQANASINYSYQVKGRLSSGAQKNLDLGFKEYKAASVQQEKKNQNISIEGMRYGIKKTAEESIEPFGYFNSKVKIEEKKTSNQITLTAIIIPGKLTTITSVSIKILGEGATDNSFINAVRNSKLKKGKSLHTEDFVMLNRLLTTIAMNKGYFDAQYKQKQIHIDKEEHSATIDIIYDSKKRYRFGKTIIKAPFFNKGFLKKYFRYKQGQAYSNNILQQTQQLLVNSGYFSQAIITPDLKNSHNGVVPINANLIAGLKKQYKIGLGYGTDTGPRLSAKITNNYISKNGHTVYSSIQFSKPSKNITIGYNIPGALPDREQYTLAAGYTNIIQDTGTSNGVKISGIFTYNREKLKRFFSINALREDYNLSSPKVKANSKMVYFSTGISYIKADNNISPSNGYRIKAEINGTINPLSNQDGFTQLLLSSHYIHTINKTMTRLLIRTEISKTNINNLTNLPLSLQLYVGGVNSIRGYQSNQIGPGKLSYSASIELQQEIYDQIYAAIYYDQGNATQSTDLFKNSYIGEGIGIGYLSIIGMIQLDYTHAINLKNKPYVLQLSMGSSL